MNPHITKRLQQALDQRKQAGLFRKITSAPGIRINLSSNDYLNLRTNPEIIRASQKATEDYGSGSGASPLLTGFGLLHNQLLLALQKWIGKKSGLLFNSGFMANQALVHHLPGPNDLILTDRLIHHSIAQALGQKNTNFHRFHHNDLDHLESLLEKNQKDYGTLFVFTESLYSMDGDSPDLLRLARLKQKHDFFWILDEAHALGVYGPKGEGLAKETEVLEHVDILVGTLGKSFASMGAFILTDSKEVTDYLTNFSGELIYSTFLPPAAAGTALAALDQIKCSRHQSKDLRELSTSFRSQLVEEGHKTIDGDSPIVPVIFDEPNQVLKVQEQLLDAGIAVAAIRPPTVPPGKSRLRLSLHTGINSSHLDEFLNVTNQCGVL
ncbi:MAG: pyridoxal phosphate-dependent aminotransferase family protein [Candidatus Nitronauta litoralis]|uniref:8-amino-7-oxononanoate synthase n=1 Tax=Candidatus Nitronauta litoralis TaxID=2705533 RepID=A0A7T0G1E7_9BACT|nr:MAG: pyridoxal phosphate-dependent aminotransferase family protein [Candidatus Nitronauta litoralis]